MVGFALLAAEEAPVIRVAANLLSFGVLRITLTTNDRTAGSAGYHIIF